MEIDYYKRELADDLPDIAPTLFTPELMLRELNNHIEKMRHFIDRMQCELTELRDVQKLKTWLRSVDDLEML